MSANPLLLFARWLAEADRDWPDKARETALHAFIDIVGVSLPGALETPTQLVFETIKLWGEGPCAAIGAGVRLPAPWAALVNGTAAHALDFDDNFDPGKTHASAVLAPAIIALAEQEGLGGEACIDAYIAGLQILGCVGEGINPRHRQLGWHATATVGAVGAAAACARLLRLDADKAGHAISLATSMASGFMSQFGTLTKPVHAGLAAKSGVLAASLARTGLEAGAETLHGRYSMRTLMAQLGEGEGGPRFREGDVGDPLLILSAGLKTKRFPNCASAHRAMDGLLELQEQHDFSAEDIESVTVEAPRSHLANLMYTDPETPAQAKFSMEHALACILIDRAATLAHFKAETLARQDIRAAYAKVRRVALDDIADDQQTITRVRLAGGSELEARLSWPAGTKARPFKPEYFREKFLSCARAATSPERSGVILETLERLPDLPDLRELTELLIDPLGG